MKGQNCHCLHVLKYTNERTRAFETNSHCKLSFLDKQIFSDKKKKQILTWIKYFVKQIMWVLPMHVTCQQILIRFDSVCKIILHSYVVKEFDEMPQRKPLSCVQVWILRICLQIVGSLLMSWLLSKRYHLDNIVNDYRISISLFILFSVQDRILGIWSRIHSLY